MNREISIDYKLNRFSELVSNYVDVVNSMIDLGVQNNLIPFKYIFGIPLMKDYVQQNKIELLEYGVIYILRNKNEILNFDIKKLDELDEDCDDNVSRKDCVSSITDIKSNINKSNNNFLSDIKENEILNLIIEIKNSSKKLDKQTRKLIHGYVELLIIILEQIKLLY
jgi:hypothetical protein